MADYDIIGYSSIFVLAFLIALIRSFTTEDDIEVLYCVVVMLLSVIALLVISALLIKCKNVLECGVAPLRVALLELSSSLSLPQILQ